MERESQISEVKLKQSLISLSLYLLSLWIYFISSVFSFARMLKNKSISELIRGCSRTEVDQFEISVKVLALK